MGKLICSLLQGFFLFLKQYHMNKFNLYYMQYTLSLLIYFFFYQICIFIYIVSPSQIIGASTIKPGILFINEYYIMYDPVQIDSLKAKFV